MRIFVVGPAGSGKNVIAAHISNKLGIEHINYRSVIIDGVKNNARHSQKLKKQRDSEKEFEVGPAFQILSEYIDKKGIGSFVLEGYPKSAAEAEMLRKYFADTDKTENHAFLIDSNFEVANERLQNRLVCPKCAYLIYDTNPHSLLPIQCMNCHVSLIKRKDDTDKGIKRRLERFVREKQGIVDSLSAISELHRVEESEGLADVISDILEILTGRSGSSLAERGARLLIENLGLNLADPNIVGTPARLAKSLGGLMHGQYEESQKKIKENLSTVFPTHYKGMVILEPINSVSLCSHHLLPVSYEVHFGYIPREQSLGFSKIIKVINILAAKPTLQEDFTKEIIDVFDAALTPKGVMVIVRGKHACMTLRGEKSDNINITSALKGVFKNHQRTRDEFLALTNFNRSMVFSGGKIWELDSIWQTPPGTSFRVQKS